jgi:hypothetical protein
MSRRTTIPFRAFSIRRTGLRTTGARAWQRLKPLFDLIIGIRSIPEFYPTSLSLHAADTQATPAAARRPDIIGPDSAPGPITTGPRACMAALPFQSAHVTIRFGGFQEFEDVVQA